MIELCSASKQLRDDVRELLSEFALEGNAWTYTPRQRGGAAHFIRLAGRRKLQLFQERIGFSNPKHMKTVEKSRNV